MNRLFWTLLGFVLLAWMGAPDRRAEAAVPNPLARQGCTMSVDPPCISEPGMIFFSAFLSSSPSQTLHYVVTVDMQESRFISIPPGGDRTEFIAVPSGVGTQRLHPKGWCRRFENVDFAEAQTLHTRVGRVVKSIKSLLSRHEGFRATIAMREASLRTVIENGDTTLVANLQEEIAKLETNDENRVLFKILHKQTDITVLYGFEHGVSSQILELNLLGFDNNYRSIPDDQEETPGVRIFANVDDDDDNNAKDLFDQNIPNEDELAQIWWFFAKPVDVYGTFTVSTASPRLRFWASAAKTAFGQLPTALSDLHQRKGVHMEGLSASTALEGEVVKGDFDFGLCQDKLNVKIAEIQILDQAQVQADHIQVARWDDGFNAIGVSDAFIRNDPERFYTRVRDVARDAEPKVTVRLRTLKMDGTTILDAEGELEIDKLAGEAGAFLMPAKPQMLMSDDVDDDFSNVDTGGVADNAKNDRTHKAECEGRYVVKYTLQDGTTTRELKVPVCDATPKEVREIRVNLIFLFKDVNMNGVIDAEDVILTGEPFQDDDADNIHDAAETYLDVNGSGTYDDHLQEGDVPALVESYRKRLQELYAQACVRILVTSSLGVAPDAIPASGQVDVSAASPAGVAAMTAHEQAILGAGLNTGTANDIEIYMVNGLTKDGGVTTGFSGGRAFPSDWYTGMPAGDINDSVFLPCSTKFYSIGHEMLHILRQETPHSADDHNLFAPTTDIILESSKNVLDSKRLTEPQCNDATRGVRHGIAPGTTTPYAYTP